MENVHILSPQYCEGMEVSKCMVGSIKICISLNSDNPPWLFFIWGLLHFNEQQEVARELGKEWAYFSPSA